MREFSTATEATYRGTQESFEELRTFLKTWAKELLYLERDERDDIVRCGVKTIRNTENSFEIHKGETLYATDKRLFS